MKPGELSTEVRRMMALGALARRKQQMKTFRESGLLPRNEDLPAGQPMIFFCIECGAPIFVDEEWIEKQEHCGACMFLIDQGWLEPAGATEGISMIDKLKEAMQTLAECIADPNLTPAERRQAFATLQTLLERLQEPSPLTCHECGKLVDKAGLCAECEERDIIARASE